MKKRKIAVCLLGIAIASIVAFFSYSAMTATKPYIVKPSSFRTASNDLQTGYSFDHSTHVLSVASSKDVVVVCDPGKSFRYVVTWIIERPRKTNDLIPVVKHYHLSKFSEYDHIHAPTSECPPEILKAANGNF